MKDIVIKLQETVSWFISQHSSNINWTKRLSENKWSAIEILGHLTDSAVVNLYRFIRCTYDSEFTLTYSQDEWVLAQNYQRADANEILALWELTNRRLITVLSSYPPDRLNAVCNGYSVEYLANDYLEHLLHHLNQIIALKNGS